MRFSRFVKHLKKIAGPGAVLERAEDLMLYEYDGGIHTSAPRAVVFPETTEQVSRIMCLASENGFPVVPRGAGTGLSGGALARDGAVVLGFSRMNRILEIDAANQRAIVQPGVINLDLSTATRPHGLYFAPD